MEGEKGDFYGLFKQQKKIFILKKNLKLHKIYLNSADFCDFFRLKLWVLSYIITVLIIGIGNIFASSNTNKIFLRKSFRPKKSHVWVKLTKSLDFWQFFTLTFRKFDVCFQTLIFRRKLHLLTISKIRINEFSPVLIFLL